MPRGNRHHLRGYVWHITARCHRRQFLLKFARDRRAWVRWLYEARKRCGLCVLNYQVTGEAQWSEAVAVGRRAFVERVQQERGPRARYRRVEDGDGVSILRDTAEVYQPHLGGKMSGLRNSGPGSEPFVR